MKNEYKGDSKRGHFGNQTVTLASSSVPKEKLQTAATYNVQHVGLERSEFTLKLRYTLCL